MNKVSKLISLCEDEVADIKTAFSSAIKKVVKPPIKLLGFAYSSGHGENEFYVLYDTPREFRHPDEYGGEDKVYNSPSFKSFSRVEDEINKIIREFSKKYLNYNFTTASGISGPGVEKF